MLNLSLYWLNIVVSATEHKYNSQSPFVSTDRLITFAELLYGKRYGRRDCCTFWFNGHKSEVWTHNASAREPVVITINIHHQS